VTDRQTGVVTTKSRLTMWIGGLHVCDK